MPRSLPLSTPALLVFVCRMISTGAREMPIPNCTTPVRMKLFSPSSRKVLPKTRASQYRSTNLRLPLCSEFSLISSLIWLRFRPRCSRIRYCFSFSFPLNFSGNALKNGVSCSSLSFCSIRSRSFRLKETGEISPRPLSRCLGSPSRSGSPFGFELTASRTRSPVARLIS